MEEYEPTSGKRTHKWMNRLLENEIEQIYGEGGCIPMRKGRTNTQEECEDSTHVGRENGLTMEKGR